MYSNFRRTVTVARVWHTFVRESCLPCGSEFTRKFTLVYMGDDVTRSRSISWDSLRGFYMIRVHRCYKLWMFGVNLPWR